ncbi:MAG: glycosyltransferase family 39 protein [Armatimonadota bacterium]|nr:glycosyltransferase family 39 protein [Armatimonadota bacterium]
MPNRAHALLPAAFFLWAAWRVWTLYYARFRFVAITDPDAEDYAQIALQLFLGRGLQHTHGVWGALREVFFGTGLTSRTIPLCGLEYLRQTGGDPSGAANWPNLHRFPFMPLVEWGLFHLYGPTDRALSAASGLFYVASVPFLYLLGRRVFGAWPAVLGATLYLFSPLALGASLSGLTEQAASFFLIVVLLLLTGPRNRAAILLAGLLWGVAFWNRYTTALLALPFCVYLWVQDRSRGVGNAAVFLLAMAAAVAPEAVRNYRLAGDPLFSLTATLMLPYKSAVAPTIHWWYVPVYARGSDILLAWPGPMLDKWRHELYCGWRYLPLTLGLQHVYPFFVLSLFLRTESTRQHRLRCLAITLMVLHELTLPLLSNIVRYYAYLSPLLILLAAWAACVVARCVQPLLVPVVARQPYTALTVRAVPALLAFLVVAGPMVLGWIDLEGEPPKMVLTRSLVDTYRSHMQVVRALVPADEVVLSNAPWSVAWRADRKSIPLPPGPSLVPFLSREYGVPVGAIYLTPRSVGAWEAAHAGAWEAVRTGDREVAGFRLARRFADGAVLLLRENTGGGHPPSARSAHSAGTG